MSIPFPSIRTLTNHNTVSDILRTSLVMTLTVRYLSPGGEGGVQDFGCITVKSNRRLGSILIIHPYFQSIFKVPTSISDDLFPLTVAHENHMIPLKILRAPSPPSQVINNTVSLINCRLHSPLCNLRVA